MSKKIGNKWVARIKVANGMFGIAATAMIFLSMAGNAVTVTIGSAFIGPTIFSMILIGNAYGLMRLAHDGYTTLQEWNAVALMHKRYTQFQKGRDSE